MDDWCGFCGRLVCGFWVYVGLFMFSFQSFAFNLVGHLASTHKLQLCSAEIRYSCDVCQDTFDSYHTLETHLKTHQQPKPTAPLPPLIPAPQAQRNPVAQFPMGQKRSAPPPMTDGAMSKMPKVTSVSSVSAAAAAKQPKMRVRFSCTPCHLRFNEYSEVLKHWEIRHLKAGVIPLCRVDQCQQCRSKIAEEMPNLPPETFEVVAAGDGSLPSAASEFSDDVIFID